MTLEGEISQIEPSAAPLPVNTSYSSSSAPMDTSLDMFNDLPIEIDINNEISDKDCEEIVKIFSLSDSAKTQAISLI